MSKSTRRLGRGLDSLVSNLRSPRPGALVFMDSPPGAERAEGTEEKGRNVQVSMCAVEALEPNPFQPRNIVDEDDIISLAASIQRSGLLQPITARFLSGRYEIIAGDRRWQAAKSLGMTHLPVIVREASDEQMLELALIENLQREDLNAIDRAKAYDQFCTRFSIKPEEVAKRLGEDRTTVVNYLRLLDLPESIQTLVARGKVSMGHARCLLGVTDEDRRQRLADSVVENGLSVRALEEIVRRERTRKAASAPTKPDTRPPRGAHLRDLERRFEEAVKTKVTIHEGRRKGSGRIIIDYYSLDDFDRISSLLGVAPE